MSRPRGKWCAPSTTKIADSETDQNQDSQIDSQPQTQPETQSQTQPESQTPTPSELEPPLENLESESQDPQAVANAARLLELQAAIPKKRTGYFIFLEHCRKELKEQQESIPASEAPRISVAQQSKDFGEKWRNLTDLEKKSYVDTAGEEKAAYLAHINEIKSLGGVVPGSGSSSGLASAGGEGGQNTGDEKDLAIPVARTRKIVSLDDEVGHVSKEAVVLLTKATEEFVKWLGKESESVASVQNRRKLVPNDIVDVCSTREVASFLREDMANFAKEAVKLEKEGETKKRAEKRKLEETKNPGGGIESFFVLGGVLN